MTKLRSFATLLFFLCVLNINAQYSRDLAIDFVVNNLLVNDIGKVNLYASKNIRFGNDGLPLLSYEPMKYPYDSNWVFFVDDHPYARWTHPCRYIFIDAVTGTDTIISNRPVYPLGLFRAFDAVSVIPPPDTCHPIYKQPDPETINGLPPNPHLYAVIIGGYEDTLPRQPQAWNDISAVYTTLEQVYGYQKANIFVHYFTGSSPIRGNDLDGGFISNDIDYAAYKDTIHHTFSCLSGQETDPLIPKLNPEDQLLVYVDDHGDGSAYHSWILLPQDPLTTNPDKNLYDNILAQWVNDINCGQMVFLLEQCRSGGFVDDLQPQNSSKCKNRSIYTSVASTEDEWMDYHISDTAYGEFVFYWTAAARGYFPDIKNNKPWLTGFPVFDTVKYPKFPYKDCFSTCPALTHPYCNPDLNGDGFVTMEEAFKFANNYDSWSPDGLPPDTGFYCPDFYIGGPLTPQRYKNISFEEDLQSLCGLTGKITHTQTIANRSYLIGGPLIVDSNAVLSFTDAGQDTTKIFFINELANLTVNPGSRLHPGKSMQFGGINSSQININGSIDLINDVTFKSIPPGTSFSGLYLNNHNIDATLRHVHFINTGLLNEGQHLRIKDTSVFINCGKAISRYGNVNISHSLFTNTSLYINNLSNPHNVSFSDSISNNFITASGNSDAVNVSNYDKFFIFNNTFSGASSPNNGLGLFYCGLGTSSNYNVVNNNISNCYTGITGFYTNAFIHNNHVYNNTIGIKSANFSNLQLIGEHFMTEGDITQAIFNNASYEIYTYFDFPFIRYNKIYDDYHMTDSLIYADYSTPDLPLPSITFDVRYNCWKNNSIPAQLCSSYGNNATFRYSPYYCFLDPIPVPIGDPDEDMFTTADSLFKADNFVGAKNLFISLIEQYPKSRYSQTALKELFGVELFATNDYHGLQHYYLTDDSIVSDSSLSKIGSFLANRCDVVLEDWEKAINWYEEQIQNPESAEDSIFAIIDLEDLYMQMENNGKKATHVGSLTQYVPASAKQYYSYRDSLLSLIPFNHKKSVPQKKISGIKSGELLQNQPNYFSTTTDIYYNLMSDFSKVDLEITDNLGRIRRLIHLNDRSAGIHKVRFSPDELCSGIYQYSLVINGNLTDTKKMVYIK